MQCRLINHSSRALWHCSQSHRGRQWFAMPGGQQCGRPVSELVQKDPGYCQWILRAAAEDATRATVSGRVVALTALGSSTDWRTCQHLEGEALSSHSWHGMVDIGILRWSLYVSSAIPEGSFSAAVQEQAEWLRENAAHLLKAGPGLQ